MGLKVPIHQSGCIPPRSNQNPGSTTNLGPPGITISSYTHFGQFGPNWGPPGAPQTPKSGPSRKKMWALCSSIITNSIKTNETVSAMKKNHGTNVSKYWLTAHCEWKHHHKPRWCGECNRAKQLSAVRDILALQGVQYSDIPDKHKRQIFHNYLY